MKDKMKQLNVELRASNAKCDSLTTQKSQIEAKLNQKLSGLTNLQNMYD